MAAFDSLNSVFVHALNPIYGVSGGLQWWEPLTMVQAGNKTYDLLRSAIPQKQFIVTVLVTEMNLRG